MDNEVEFQNSAFNDWNILSIIGRIDVATAASVEETAAAVVNSAKKNRVGHVGNGLHFQRGIESIVAPEQESYSREKIFRDIRRNRHD